MAYLQGLQSQSKVRVGQVRNFSLLLHHTVLLKVHLSSHTHKEQEDEKANDFSATQHEDQAPMGRAQVCLVSLLFRLSTLLQKYGDFTHLS